MVIPLKKDTSGKSFKYICNFSSVEDASAVVKILKKFPQYILTEDVKNSLLVIDFNMAKTLSDAESIIRLALPNKKSKINLRPIK